MKYDGTISPANMAALIAALTARAAQQKTQASRMVIAGGAQPKVHTLVDVHRLLQESQQWSNMATLLQRCVRDEWVGTLTPETIVSRFAVQAERERATED